MSSHLLDKSRCCRPSGALPPRAKSLWALGAVLLGALTARAQMPPPASSPAGFVMDESECASGGPAYSFFADGTVLVEDCGDACPIFMEGTWSQKGDQLELVLTRAFFGKGEESTLVQPVGASNVYGSYRAEVEDLKAKDSIKLTWEGSSGDSCQKVYRHKLASNSARAKLRGAFVGSYPFLSQREVTADDLKTRPKAELARMRNEIFAAYGYKFKDPSLAKHFRAMKGYAPRFADVNAFLSDLERRNVETIKAAEKGK